MRTDLKRADSCPRRSDYRGRENVFVLAAPACTEGPNLIDYGGCGLGGFMRWRDGSNGELIEQLGLTEEEAD